LDRDRAQRRTGGIVTRSVLVTGCSTGLGLECAVHLAERGFDVYASMRDLSRRGALDAEAARREIKLHILQLDVTDPASVDAAVRQVADDAGGIWGLVNNAGVGLRGYFEDLQEKEIYRVFEANVFGTMRVTRAVIPHMREARQGRIVVMGSIGGRIASFGVSAYCASKFAQEGFAEALMQELRPFGVYVSLVEPGITKTERWGSNRAIAERATDPKSPYYAWFVEGERIADRLVATSPTRPEAVAWAVYHALTAPQPRLRYVVGWRAQLFVLLRRYLPEPIFERLHFGTAIRWSTRAGVPTAGAT
jgi:NAD(P)-dependent dehydrogenase (short-subunit alcohol dehydrogenase family)